MTDTPETIHVEITALDIERGEDGVERNPVALACQRAGFNVHVYPPGVNRDSPIGYFWGFPNGAIDLPDEVSAFLAGWFNRQPVEPLAFDVTIPASKQEQGPVAATTPDLFPHQQRLVDQVLGRRVRVYGETGSDESPPYTPEPVLLAEVSWPDGCCFPVTVTYGTVRAGVGQEDAVDPVVAIELDGWYYRPDSPSKLFSDIHFEVVGELARPSGIGALVEATRRFHEELLGDQDELLLDDGGVRVPRAMVMRAVDGAVQASLSGANAALVLDDLLDEIRAEALGLRF